MDHLPRPNDSERLHAATSIRDYCQGVIRNGLRAYDAGDDSFWFVSLDRRLAEAELVPRDVPLTDEEVQACRREEGAEIARYCLRQIQEDGNNELSQWNVDRLHALIAQHGLLVERDLKISEDELRWIILFSR